MKVLLDKIFPYRNIRNIAMFYVLSAVYNAWIVAGVWVFIWGTFMTKTQIGLSDLITFTVGFIVEVPSGVIADLMGRKKAIVLGNILLSIGNFGIALSSSFFGITGWYLMWAIGYAFQSGATEALAYDSLPKVDQEERWSLIISTATIIAKTSALVCTAFGGMLFAWNVRLPYFVSAIIGIVGIITALNLKEIMVKSSENRWSVHIFLNQIKDGVSTLATQKVKMVALLSLTISSIGYIYNWGILRPLTGERFGFTPTTYSLLLAVTSFFGIVAVFYLPKIQKIFNLEKFIFLVTALYALIYFSIGFDHALFIGGALMILLSIGLLYNDILFSQYINKFTKPEHRATTLSAVALCTKLPYIAIVMVVANSAENNKLPSFTMALGLVAVSVWAYSFFKQFGGTLLPSLRNSRQ